MTRFHISIIRSVLSVISRCHLSVELDSEDVAGVTVVADFRALLEVVNVHTLWCTGAHNDNQTA